MWVKHSTFHEGKKNGNVEHKYAGGKNFCDQNIANYLDSG